MVPAAVVDASIARSRAAARTGRHDHRRRQLVLHRRHPARATSSQAKGIDYVDVGTSGGVWGLERGYCMMIGGPDATVAAARPDLQDARAGHRRRSTRTPGRPPDRARPNKAICTAAPAAPATSSRWCTTASSTASWPRTPKGWACCKSANVGKQTHAIDAETTPLRDPEHYQYDLDLAARSPKSGGAAASSRRGCSISPRRRSSRIRSSRSSRGRVSDSGEGRWTIKAAIDEAVPAPVLTDRALRSASARAAKPSSRTSCSRRCASSSAAISRRRTRNSAARRRSDGPRGSAGRFQSRS